MSKTYLEVQEAIKKRQQALIELSQQLFSDVSSIVLEVGCGHGHFLTAYAETHPEKICVGIDLINRRIEKGNSKKLKRNIKNVYFIKSDLNEFLQSLPKTLKIEVTFMLFPDPWPKKRHHKNRMVQPAFLHKLHQLTAEEGQFCFRTDHMGYFEWTREHIQQHPKWEWDPDATWPFEQESFFQNLMESWQSLIAKRLP